MFKKYGIFVFFSFLFMLCGITLLSVLNAKLPYSIIEEVEQEEPSNAASLDITLNIDNVYGMGGSSSSGATISGYVGLHRDNGETANSKYFSIGTRPGTETVISTNSQALNYYRYVRIDSVSISSAGKDGSSTLRTTETQVTSTDSQGGSNGPAVITGYYDDCRLSSLSGGARFRMNIYWSIYYSCNTNGGSGGNSSFIYDTYNKRMIVSGSTVSQISTPSRTGYKFKGYYTETSGGTQVIDANGRFLLNRSSAKPEQLYAQWTANKYTVSYNLNGSDSSYGTYHPTSWTYNTAQQISNPTRTHYDFAGWSASNLTTSTAVYGTGSNPTTSWNGTTKIKASSTNGALYFKNLRSTSGTVTLTANWTAKQYTLTFNANGGSVSTATRQVAYGSTYGTLPTPTRTGYTFVGWYTAASGGNQVTSSTRMTTAGATIYAHWTANTYVVNFDATNYMPYPVTSVAFNGSGGDFTYSNINNEIVHRFTFRDNIDMYGASTGFYIDLSALTAEEEYEWSIYVKSTRRHAISIGQEQGGKIDAEVTTSWTRITHKFTATTPGTTAFVIYRGNGSWAIGEVFEFKNLSIQKASDTPADQATGNITVTYDGYYTNLPTPTRYGYNFTGWYTSASSGSQVTSSTQVKTANNHTLYSRWTAKTDCVLSFNANRGTVSPARRNQTFNASLGTLPVPTRTGYIFTGWYTSASRGSEVTSSTIMKSESMTIYAHWAETWVNHTTKPTGYGNEKSPYLISTAENLAWLINNHATQYYQLTDHIDMSRYYWVSVGTSSKAFSGIFDGQGYAIKGLHTISQSLRRDGGGDNSGFIGVASGATIKNIFFENISISGKNYVGAVIGKVKGSNKTNVSGIAVRNDKTTVGERLVEATGTKGIIVGYSEVSQAAVVRDCLGVQGTSCGAYFQVATVDCKDSIGYIWNGNSYSMSKSAASNNFANWITVTGIPFQLPAGFAWIAEGK